MPARDSSARWNGSLKEGKGTMKLGSGAYEGPYSFPSRFEDGDGTNPEELIEADDDDPEQRANGRGPFHGYFCTITHYSILLRQFVVPPM